MMLRFFINVECFLLNYLGFLFKLIKMKSLHCNINQHLGQCQKTFLIKHWKMKLSGGPSHPFLTIIDMILRGTGEDVERN